MKGNNTKRTYILICILMLVLLLGFFAFIFAMSYLQDHRQTFYEKHENVLIATLAVYALATLVIVFIAGKKGFAAEILLSREKLLKTSKPFIQSRRPLESYESLMHNIISELAADGFKINDDVELHAEARASLAYRAKFSFVFDYVGEYIFLIQGEGSTAGTIDLGKAAGIIGRTEKKRLALGQTNLVVFCIFCETVDHDLAKDILGFYSEELQFIVSAYELQTGNIYFMNGKKNRFSRLAGIQKLICKYIAGCVSAAHVTDKI